VLTDFLTMDDPYVAHRFDAAMYGIHEEARRRGYQASRFIQMVEQHGGVETARRLLATPTPQQGFTTLWEMGEPTLTVEFHVLQPEFTTLFSPTEKNEARKRLEAIGFRRPRGRG
jgi:hypothetical protein